MTVAGGRDTRWTKREAGQGAVETALVMPMVFALLLGFLELGVAFNAYVTVVSAAREGARAGAVFVYDSSLSQATNDQNRSNAVRDAVESSLGILRRSPPSFDRDLDVSIGYVHDASLPLLFSRRGDLIAVDVTYRHELLSKLMSSNPSLTLTGRAQARIE